MIRSQRTRDVPDTNAKDFTQVSFGKLEHQYIVFSLFLEKKKTRHPPLSQRTCIIEFFESTRVKWHVAASASYQDEALNS